CLRQNDWEFAGKLRFPQTSSTLLLEAGGQKTADNLLSAGEHTRILTSLPASLVCLSGCSPPSVNSQSGCYPLMRREVYPNPARLARDSSTNLRTLASF